MTFDNQLSNNDSRMSNRPAPDADFDALTRATLAVFRAHQALINDGDALAAAWRLNSAKWKTLGAIALAGAPITGPDIGRSMGLSRQGVQKQLDALMKRALVNRVSNEADARAPLYRLTPKGEAVYREVTDAWRIRSQALARGIDGKALLSAAQALHRIADAITATPQGGSKSRSKR